MLDTSVEALCTMDGVAAIDMAPVAVAILGVGVAVASDGDDTLDSLGVAVTPLREPSALLDADKD